MQGCMQVGVRDDVVDFPPRVDPLTRKSLANRSMGAHWVPQPFSGIADRANPLPAKVPSELPYWANVNPEWEEAGEESPPVLLTR